MKRKKMILTGILMVNVVGAMEHSSPQEDSFLVQPNQETVMEPSYHGPGQLMYPAIEHAHESSQSVVAKEFLLYVQNMGASTFLRDALNLGGVDKVIVNQFSKENSKLQLVRWMDEHEYVIRLCKKIEGTNQSFGLDLSFIPENKMPRGWGGLMMIARARQLISVDDVSKSFQGKRPSKNPYLTWIKWGQIKEHLLELHEQANNELNEKEEGPSEFEEMHVKLPQGPVHPLAASAPIDVPHHENRELKKKSSRDKLDKLKGYLGNSPSKKGK